MGCTAARHALALHERRAASCAGAGSGERCSGRPARGDEDLWSGTGARRCNGRVRGGSGLHGGGAERVREVDAPLDPRDVDAPDLRQGLAWLARSLARGGADGPRLGRARFALLRRPHGAREHRARGTTSRPAGSPGVRGGTRAVRARLLRGAPVSHLFARTAPACRARARARAHAEAAAARRADDGARHEEHRRAPRRAARRGVARGCRGGDHA